MPKFLLDENLPARLKFRFPPDIEVFTVYDMVWNSMKNGILLKAMEDENFDGLIISDQNLIYQQNIENFSFKIYIINATNNRYDTILPLVSKIYTLIKSETKDQIHIIE